MEKDGVPIESFSVIQKFWVNNLFLHKSDRIQILDGIKGIGLLQEQLVTWQDSNLGWYKGYWFAAGTVSNMTRFQFQYLLHKKAPGSYTW